jgi:hypothetical protein
MERVSVPLGMGVEAAVTVHPTTFIGLAIWAKYSLALFGT